MKIRWFAAALFAAMLGSGCSSQQVLQPAIEATIGQQLIDLKKARDSGALSPQEYERQKRQMIDDVR